jgi:hypothetical protein
MYFTVVVLFCYMYLGGKRYIETANEPKTPKKKLLLAVIIIFFFTGLDFYIAKKKWSTQIKQTHLI